MELREGESAGKRSDDEKCPAIGQGRGPVDSGGSVGGRHSRQRWMARGSEAWPSYLAI